MKTKKLYFNAEIHVDVLEGAEYYKVFNGIEFIEKFSFQRQVNIKGKPYIMSHRGCIPKTSNLGSPFEIHEYLPTSITHLLKTDLIHVHVYKKSTW